MRHGMIKYSIFEYVNGVNFDQIGNHHLWHDKHIFKGWMISDALHDAMVKEGITGLVFHKDKDNTEFD